MNIKYDKYKYIEPSKAYLAKPNRERLCALNSIDAESTDFHGKANDISTISFTIDKYIQNEKCEKVLSNGYNWIGKYMKLFITGIGWFIMDSPEVHNTGTKEYKTINANSAQIEYNQVTLDSWKVNCGTTDSLEMLVDGNVEEIDGVEFAKEQIKFCNETNHSLSLVHILVNKLPNWTVGHIDNIPKTYETIEDGEIKTTSVLLKDEIGKFNIDYMSCYSFMTQDFEKYFNVIVDFDYLNMTVNFYRVENYGKDTNVTIGFRNVENSSDITVDEENVFTKYRVSGGDDLGIEQVNGGDDYLIYLDEYWLNEKYLTQSTINKYKAWYEYCKSARSEYAELSKQWVKQQDIISEIYNRIPITDCSQNWNEYSDDDLLIAKSDYGAEKIGYESIYVDENGDFDINLLDASDDANKYHQIVDVILPNIEIEISNRKLPSSIDIQEYIKTYETTWEYYGIYELEAKLKSYKDIVSLFQKDHYDITYDEYQKLSANNNEKYPPHTKEGHDNQYTEYLESANNLDLCEFALMQRHQEAKVEEDKQKLIQQSRITLDSKMAMNTWSDVSLGSFTKEELDDIAHIINPTTYTNENIFVTSTDSAVDKIIIQQKLCDTALEDLQVYSIPQTICSVSLDNIISAAGNELHVHDLDYGNFIRVGLRDDYYIKLRMIGMSYNPFLYDNNLSFEFSNMIRSCSKRNDFVSLLNLGNNLTNSSANTSYDNNNQITDDNIYGILQKLLTRYGITSNGQVGGNGDKVTAGNIETEMIKVIDIHSKDGFFQYLQSQLISAGQIIAGSAEFKDLSALVGQIDTLLSGTFSAELGHLIHLTAETVSIDEAVIKDLIAAHIMVSDLMAGDITLTDKMRILSENGSMIMNGETLQIMGKKADGTQYVAIQLGYSSTGKPSLIINDETGAVMLDAQGLHEAIVPDNFIKNDMLAGGITKEKLAFHVVETDENGKVNASDVTINGQGLDAKFTTIETTIEETKNSISSVELKVNNNTKAITQKASQSDITTAINDYDGSTVKTIRDTVAGNTLEIGKVKTQVSDVVTTVSKKADSSTVSELSSKLSAHEQDANGFKQTVSATYATKTETGKIQSDVSSLSGSVATWTNNVTKELQEMQNQIDGAIETWFNTPVPTLSNAPANTWNTNDLKNIHLGDLYYDGSGFCYRFQLDGSTYKWIRIKDSDVTKALADAANAQNIANVKKRVFTTTPTVPYEINDLWLNNKELYRCKTTKTSGSYSSTDWEVAVKYTDDTKANQIASNLSTNYSTTTQMNSAITQKADQIKSEVSQSYETKEHANSQYSEINQRAGSIESTVSSVQTVANAANSYVNNAKNNYGYQYAVDITVNGEPDKYYPVVIKGGNQDVKREIMIKRSYSEKAPAEWAGHPTTHGIALTAVIKCNFGGRGGANYSWCLHDLEEMYGHVFAGAVNCGRYTMFAIFLRGGGTTGAIYHLYSDQSLTANIYKPTSTTPAPQICYNSDQIFLSGTYTANAPAPRTYTNSVIEEIKRKKYIDLSQTNYSSISSLTQKADEIEGKVQSNTGDISTLTQRATSLESVIAKKQDVSITAIRYIRDWLDGNSVDAENRWVECNVMVDDTNIAAGIIPVCKDSALNTVSISNASVYTDTYLLDDGTPEYYVSRTGKSCLELDLGSIRYDIDSIKIWHYYMDNRVYNHQLQVSKDGLTWVTLYDSKISGGYMESDAGAEYFVSDSSISGNFSSVKQTVGKIEGTIHDVDGKLTQVTQKVDEWSSTATDNEELLKNLDSKIIQLNGDFTKEKNNMAKNLSDITVKVDGIDQRVFKVENDVTDIADIRLDAKGWKALFAQLDMYDMPNVQTNISIDINGITVTNPLTGQQTKMTINEFAGYYNNEKIFYLSQDTTMTKQVYCEKGWDTGYIKMTTNAYTLPDGRVIKGVAYVKSRGTS